MFTVPFLCEGARTFGNMCIVAHKSHDPCFHTFLMDAGVMTFLAHCTLSRKSFRVINENFKVSS